MDITVKQAQFNRAMELYTSKARYMVFRHLISSSNIALQLYLLYRIWPLSIGPLRQILALVAAYLLTDFINGLVHMYMDNNERYESIDGPLIANFHLHHKTPVYTKRNLLLVYFMETDSKVWLVGYLLLIVALQALFEINSAVLYTLVYIGILSSVAEVSHYLCHSSTAPTALFLARIGLLLTQRHHAPHHLQDNTSYAFLNGVTDPLLNLIARACCKGYKQHTDLHYAHYTAADAESR